MEEKMSNNPNTAEETSENSKPIVVAMGGPGVDAGEALKIVDGKDIIEETAEALKKDLDGANVETKSENIYELQGATELISTIPSMNYMELTKLQRDMNKEIENINSAMNLIKSIEEMKNPDELGRKIALNNVLSDEEYKKDTSEFKRTYEGNLKKLTDVVNALNVELAKYNDVPKGTKFLTDHMIDTLNKAISRFTGVEDQHQKELNVLLVTLEAYKNRTCYDYLISKAKPYDICTIKADLIENTGKCSRLTQKQFSTIFSDVQIVEFNKYISTAFGNQERVVNTFLCHLGKLIKAGKDNGKYNFVKVIVMNVLDIVAGIYDLEGGKEEFDKKLEELYEIYK